MVDKEIKKKQKIASFVFTKRFAISDALRSFLKISVSIWYNSSSSPKFSLAFVFLYYSFACDQISSVSLSENVCALLLFLNDIFAEYRILLCQFFSLLVL